MSAKGGKLYDTLLMIGFIGVFCPLLAAACFASFKLMALALRWLVTP